MCAQALSQALDCVGIALSAVLSGGYDFKGSQARYARRMQGWLQEAKAHSIDAFNLVRVRLVLASSLPLCVG